MTTLDVIRNYTHPGRSFQPPEPCWIRTGNDRFPAFFRLVPLIFPREPAGKTTECGSSIPDGKIPVPETEYFPLLPANGNHGKMKGSRKKRAVTGWEQEWNRQEPHRKTKYPTGYTLAPYPKFLLRITAKKASTKISLFHLSHIGRKA